MTTASGDLTLDHLAGRIDGKSASGDIVIESPRGQLRVSTASGDVTLVEAILDRCELTTVSGSLDGTVVLAGTGPYRLNTVSGDAELQLGVLSGSGQPDAFTLESSSMSGDLEVDGVARKLGRRRWHIGTGTEPAGTIRLTSVSGDASVRVEPATIDGDLIVPSGPWPGGDWPIDRPDDERPKGRDPEPGDLSERISTSVDSAVGKVDWAGIDATIDHALDTAFRWPRRPEPASAPPTVPAAPQPPTPPAPPTTGRGDDPATDAEPAARASSGSGATKRDPEPATAGGESTEGRIRGRAPARHPAPDRARRALGRGGHGAARRDARSRSGQPLTRFRSPGTASAWSSSTDAPLSTMFEPDVPRGPASQARLGRGVPMQRNEFELSEMVQARRAEIARGSRRQAARPAPVPPGLGPVGRRFRRAIGTRFVAIGTALVG